VMIPVNMIAPLVSPPCLARAKRHRKTRATTRLAQHTCIGAVCGNKCRDSCRFCRQTHARTTKRHFKGNK